MISIFDCEAERVVNLTDVDSKEELQARLDLEDEDIMNVLNDTPFFAQLVGEDSRLDADGCEQLTCTYEEWMTENRAWAQSCLE